jgi:hypothetical protein
LGRGLNIFARDFHELSYTTKDENSFPWLLTPDS